MRFTSTMPSHVRVRCEVVGARVDVDGFVARHFVRREGEAPALDFETVVATPDVVRATECSERAELGLFVVTGIVAGEDGDLGYAPDTDPSARWPRLPRGLSTRAALAAWLERHEPDALEQGRRQLAALRAVGCTDWYAWRLRHWGTKWNAASPDALERSPGRAAFSFETPWSFPTPIFERLASTWPGLVFHVEACEQTLAFGGAGTFNGAPGDAPFALGPALATSARYARVFGEAPPL